MHRRSDPGRPGRAAVLSGALLRHAALALSVPLILSASPKSEMTELARFKADQGAQRKFARITPATVAKWLDEDFYAIEGRPAVPEATSARLQVIEDRLLTRSGLPTGIRVVVDDCGDKQADTRKQGVVRVCDTLLPAFESEDEVAWLLAHESSHVILGHGNSDAVAGGLQGLSLVGSIAVLVGSMTLGRFALVPGLSGFMHVLAIPNGLASGYRPPQELQADRMAVDLLVGAGYSPNEGLSGLGHVLACGQCTTKDSGRRSPGFWQSVFPDGTKLDTHPQSATRYQALNDYVTRNYAQQSFGTAATATSWTPGGSDPVSAHVSFARTLDDVSRDLEPVVAASIGRRPEGEGRSLCQRDYATLKRLSPQAGGHRAYRRLTSALLFACGQKRRSLETLRAEIGTPQATRTTMYMVMALALELGDDRLAGEILGRLSSQPRNAVFFIPSVRDLYDLGCAMHSRPLIEAVNRICLPAMQGLPSGPNGISAQTAFCEQPRVTALEGNCTSMFHATAPQSPVGYLGFNDIYFQQVFPPELYP